MPKQLHIRYDLCTGCRACELACALKKEAAFWTEASSIRVRQVGIGPLDIPTFCHQCSDYPCIQACPSKNKALSVGPEGIVLVNDSNCHRANGIDCQRCKKACLGNSIAYHPVSNLPMFCDRCQGDPECAKVCASGALSVTDNESFDGSHYALPEKQIANELCLRLYGTKNIK